MGSHGFKCNRKSFLWNLMTRWLTHAIADPEGMEHWPEASQPAPVLSWFRTARAINREGLIRVHVKWLAAPNTAEKNPKCPQGPWFDQTWVPGNPLCTKPYGTISNYTNVVWPNSGSWEEFTVYKTIWNHIKLYNDHGLTKLWVVGTGDLFTSIWPVSISPFVSFSTRALWEPSRRADVYLPSTIDPSLSYFPQKALNPKRSVICLSCYKPHSPVLFSPAALTHF